jgi:hypothetical protein
VILACYALFRWVWYPGAFFDAGDMLGLVGLMFVVDAVLGPSLTAVVYRRGKPGLKFDMMCIAAVQLAALVYGTYVAFNDRPAFAVFMRGAIDVATVSDVTDRQYPTDLHHPSILGVQYVAMDPMSAAATTLQDFNRELEGDGPFKYPRNYLATAEALGQIKTARSLASLRKMDENRANELATLVATCKFATANPWDILVIPGRFLKADLAFVYVPHNNSWCGPYIQDIWDILKQN